MTYASTEGLRPISDTAAPEDPLVTLKLSQLQWIRDRIALMRMSHPLGKKVWEQVSSIYIEKAAEAAASRKPS